MRRSRILALLALLVATPVVAQQVMQVRPIIRPVVVTPQAQTVQQDSDAAQKVMTIEEAKARIAALAKQKRDLDARLTEALARIDEMTKRGGSLVHAYCESETLSRNTAGASQNCAAGGYVCGEVSGLCKTLCVTSDDCSANHRCLLPQGRCVPA